MATWAVISPSRPSWMAARKGSICASTSSRVSSMMGSDVWLSASVAPCPGKCLATVTSPASCCPLTKARPSSETRGTLSPYERTPMTGLRGLRFTSSTGARFMLNPNRLRSSPWALTRRVGQLGRAGGAQGHVAGQDHHLVLDAHHVAPLLIQREEGGDVIDQQAPQPVVQPGHLPGVADVVLEEADPTHLVAPHQLLHVLVHLGAVEAHHHQLTHPGTPGTGLPAASPPARRRPGAGPGGGGAGLPGAAWRRRRPGRAGEPGG